MTAPTALIDGDIVAYHVAARCQKDGSWDGGAPTFEEAEVRADVAKMLDDWTKAAGAGDRVVLLTGRGNFRKLVEPTYKLNRVDKPKPAALGFARDVLVQDHGARLVDGLEADDLIGLMLTGTMSDGRGVAVSLDKDLRTVPGLHCNPKKGGVQAIGDLAADTLWMTQVLTGDPVDGYGGAPGIGPAKAKKALGTFKLSVTALWPRVVETYRKVGLTPDDALRTARLARILRTGDYDKTTREVLLWHPDKPERLALPTPEATP
jgi:DNA polymerase I